MLRYLALIDIGIRKFLTAFCAVALFTMVAFTVYTVFMRYVFLDPPMWGDILTLFSNIWLVFIALTLTVREREHIALNFIYSWLPPGLAFGMQQLWTLVILGLGVVLAVYGFEVAWTNPGMYWELGYLPKKYPMLILPLTGSLVALGALVAFIEDCVHYRRGTFKVSAGLSSG